MRYNPILPRVAPEKRSAVGTTGKDEPAHLLPVCSYPEMPRVGEFIVIWAYTLMLAS